MLTRILKTIARRRLFIAAIAVALLGGVVYAETRASSLDISYVSVLGNLKAKERAEIYEHLLVYRNEIGGIRDIKSILDQVSWIDHVEVTRRWPDQIMVAVTKEKPIAYWNNDAYIDARGKVFHSPWTDTQGLAELSGPPETEREVMQQYQQLSRALGRSGRGIASLSLDARGAWEFTTTDGIGVKLGKDDIMDRFQRFLLVLDSKTLASRTSDIKQIDTRYSNGVAVSWKEKPEGLDVAKTNYQRDLGL